MHLIVACLALPEVLEIQDPALGVVLGLLWGRIPFRSGNGGRLCHVADPHSVDLYVKRFHAGIG